MKCEYEPNKTGGKNNVVHTRREREDQWSSDEKKKRQRPKAALCGVERMCAWAVTLCRERRREDVGITACKATLRCCCCCCLSFCHWRDDTMEAQIAT